MDMLRVHSQDLQDHVVQEIGECLESGLYTDLAIRCGEGQTLHAHKLVLSAVSPYIHSLLENNDWEDVQTVEMSDVSVEEMQMLLEVIYNGAVEATIEDLRKLVLLTHRLYIKIPLSSELMQSLDLTLPPRPAFKRVRPSNVSISITQSKQATSAKPNGVASPLVEPVAAVQLQAAAQLPKLNFDPSTMTKVLAHSRNNEHVCPICNSKYNNVGNFKQHMKLHDNEALREQRNAVLSEMIATCFNPQTSLYTCHVCNSNYNHSGNFKQHLLKHERESGSISATLVAQASSNPHLTNVLKSAMADRVDNGDEPVANHYQYQCEHCNRTFKHPGNYKQHLASHLKKSNFGMNKVDSTNKVNAMFGCYDKTKAHPALVVPTGPPDVALQMVACPECHLEFPGVDLLQAHISVSHKHLDVKLPDKPVELDESELNSVPSWHTPSTTGPDPAAPVYNCKVCNEGFRKMAKLTAHMKVHRTFEEHYNHPCDICGKRFTRPQHVARHKMLHTGERPFKCPRCPRQFTREDKLRHHLTDSECSGQEHQFGNFWGETVANNSSGDDLNQSDFYAETSAEGDNGETAGDNYDDDEDDGKMIYMSSDVEIHDVELEDEERS